MKKRFIFIVITIVLYTPSFAQDEIVFKNMAASFQRSLPDNRSYFEPPVKAFIFAACRAFSRYNQDFKRSLQKISRKEDSVLSNTHYLIEGTLNYYFDFTLKDSTTSPFPEEIKLFSQSMCNCLESNHYTKADSFKSMVYVFCLRNLIKDSAQNVKFQQVINKKNYADKDIYNKTNAHLSLAKHCMYFRRFLIAKITNEVKKELFY